MNETSISRKPTALQGWTLVSTAWLAAAASAIIAPVLPKISENFRDTPHVALMISLVATLPALFVALLAGPSGVVADRIGHRRLLLVGLSLYGFCGIAPFWLHTLSAIVVSRAGVGIMEAIIMTCGTAMLGDYFEGDDRERWLAYQTGTSTVLAIILVAAGGALGETGWRYPFLAYSLTFVLPFLVFFFTWESGKRVENEHWMEADDTKFRWNKLVWICLLTVFASTAFFVVIVQLGFLLTLRGYSSPKLIGLGSGISSLAVPAGAILFRVLRIRVAGKLALSFGFSAAGFFILALAHTYAMTIVGAAVNGLGSGIILPCLITWALSTLGPKVRGRGTGAWQSSMFFGQFLSPIIILLLTHALGALDLAVFAYAVMCSIACIIAVACLTGLRRPSGLVVAGDK
jgi:MFS family permease